LKINKIHFVHSRDHNNPVGYELCTSRLHPFSDSYHDIHFSTFYLTDYKLKLPDS